MTWICRAAAVIVPALWVLAIWTVSPAAGQPAAEGPPARSTTKPPSWVDIVDLGALDKRLTGLSAPRGVKVEIVGEHAALNHLAGLAFADSGELYVLSWIPAVACDISAIEIQYRGGVRKAVRASKKTRDQLVALRDENSDGNFDSSRVLMADLELPSGLCLQLA